MTRPNLSPLVMDGQTVKLRLMAKRQVGTGVTHVDWLRFTCSLRDAPFDPDVFFPPEKRDVSYWEHRQARIQAALKEIEHQEYFTAAGQALSLAHEVAEVLGEGFEVDPQVRPGHDFYAHRWSINLNGKEAGWVGYGVSSSSPRQKKQSRTIHCNLYGAACTFARDGWASSLADKLESWDATITRVDLAVDFFDGYAGGLDAVVAAYKSGLCDVGGKRPKCNMVGDWVNGQARSFYLGSKEAGKQTNCYEKGHQLFGIESGSKWTRFELRYGNKLRFLPVDVLRRPDDYFAGASDWHASIVRECSAAVFPEPIKTTTRLADETADAALFRVFKWFTVTAAPTVSLMVKHCAIDLIADVIEHAKLPARVASYTTGQISAAFERLTTTQRTSLAGLSR